MDIWQISEWLEAEIIKRGWTIKEAARELKMSESSLRYIIDKRGLPRLDSLYMALDALGCELKIQRKEPK